MEQLRPPLDGFSWTLKFAYVSKICRENQVWLKSKNNKRHFTWRPTLNCSSYLAQLFLEREMFQTELEEKIKTHILCSVIFFFPRKSCCLRDNAEKYRTAGQAMWQYKTAHALGSAGYLRQHTHTHTHTPRIILIAFPLQRWLHEPASVLR